jgi:hypothetical protein
MKNDWIFLFIIILLDLPFILLAYLINQEDREKNKR